MTTLYHATRPVLLSRIVEEGLRSASGYSHFGPSQVGVSTTTNLAVAASGSFGNLILALNAEALARSYTLRPYKHPAAPNEAEVRVIDDGASETVIPFSYVTAIYRVAPKVPRFEAKELRELVKGVPIYVIWGNRITDLGGPNLATQ